MVACELPKGHPPEALRCPRCDSADTKFCYYNNYNTSQPRHFCKSCKRYWTAGGTLRNVPVGGGLKKNRKSKLLSQVKDMISSSSSSDELFHGHFPVGNSYEFSQNGFPNEGPRPLSYASPLFMPSPSSSADVHGDGTLAGSHAFRSINPAGFGFFGENCPNGEYTVPVVDPNSLDVRQHAQYHEDYSRALPVQQQGNGGIQRLHGPAGADQAQSHSGGVSDAPSEPSQASSEVAKDPYLSRSAEFRQSNVQQFELGQINGEALKHVQGEGLVVMHQSTTHESIQSHEHGNFPLSGGVVVVQDSQSKGKSSVEGDNDEINNVVNVRCPHDWEQVSEVLIGGTPDFFQLSTY